jgi:hypothetical protein
MKTTPMDQVSQNKLIYRRQYIVCPKTIPSPFLHRLIQLSSDLFLYAQEDLLVAEYESNKTRLVLLGDIFDFRNTGYDNLTILKQLVNYDFELFVKKLAGYAGRFVIFYIQGDSIRVVHDATATRKVYYGKNAKGIWMASQPYLLARVAGFPETSDQDKLAFYGSKEFHKLFNSNIGDTTIFDDLHQLLPNHYLDAAAMVPVRYWPDKKVDFLPVDQVADKCAYMLRGIVESIASRYDVMVPVTGGKDSRTIFSATHNISDRVFYYLNYEKSLNEEHNDIQIPTHLLKRLKLKFNLVDPYKIPVDKDFEAIYRKNMDYPIDHFLPHIYNYYQNYSDKVNLPGIFVGSAYEMYGTYDRNLSGEILARIIGVEKYPYAVKYYENWLSHCRDTCKTNNVNLFTLLYWEERLANWGTQVQLYKDIAQEDFMPYNSREFIENFFSAHPKYNDRPGYILYRKIIERLWPEALEEPFNPGFRHNIFEVLHFLGVLDLVRKLRFIWIFKVRSR